MQIFSWIILLIYIYIILASKSNKQRFVLLVVLNLVMCIHFESGYFIKISGFELNYDQITSFLTLIFGVLSLRKRISKSLLIRFYLYLGSILFGVLGILLFPYGKAIVTGNSDTYDAVISGNTTLNYIKIDSGVTHGIVFAVIFSVIVLCAWQTFVDEDYVFLVRKTAFYCKAIFIYGVIEAVVVYVFHSSACRTVINYVFGIGRSTFSDLIVRDNGFMLQGLTREASHYAFALFISIIIIFVNEQIERRKGYVWYIIYLVLAILSFSLSSVLYLLGLALLFILFKIKKNPQNAISKIQKLLFGIVIEIIVLILAYFIIISNYDKSNNYLIQRLGDSLNSFKILFNNFDFAIFNDVQYRSSNMIRLFSVINTFKLLIERPLFGFGIGTLTCHGSTAMFMGDVGLVGMYLWYKMVAGKLNREKYTQMDYLFYRIAIVVYLVINIFSSRYLVPYTSIVAIIYIICAKIAFGNQYLPSYQVRKDDFEIFSKIEKDEIQYED